MKKKLKRRNPIAKALMNPVFKPKTVPDKKKQKNKKECRGKQRTEI